MLKPGDVFKTATDDVWYVDTVSQSGAYCVHLSAHPGPLTTRKGTTKVVKRHLRNAVFSLNAIVDLVDPHKLDLLQLKRRLAMARKEGTVMSENEAPTTETAPAKVHAPRVAYRYARTDKAPVKELRGQAKETFDILNAAGQALTTKEISDRAVYAGTRQDKERIAGFYVAQFKRDGLVNATPLEPAAPPTTT